MKRILYLLALLALIWPATTIAAEFRGSDKESQLITKDQKVKNLYVFGQTVTSEADVEGDLLSAGNFVNITGSVENSAMIAGNDISLKGNIGNSVRAAGAVITIDGNIGQDLLVGSGTIRTSPSATIGDDAIISAGSAQIEGHIGRNLKASAGDITINGRIDGSANIYADKVTIGENAIIDGKLIYKSPNAAQISPNAKINGGVEHQTTANKEQTKKWLATIFSIAVLIKLLMGIFSLLLLVWLMPKISSRFVGNAFEKPLVSLGAGLAYLILVPIIGIILAVIVIGLKLAFLIWFIYLATLLFASIFVPLLVGSAILFWTKKERYNTSWLAILIGVPIAMIISFIPIVGPLVIFLLFLLSLGAWTTIKYDYLGSERKVTNKQK